MLQAREPRDEDGAALLALAAIVFPTLSASALETSKQRVDDGDLVGALASARRAESLLPFSASAALQQAQVLELGEEFAEAAEAARRATEREPTKWRNWFALSEIEAARGEEAAAAALERARELNPRSTVIPAE